jgi:hypothetical protein
MTVSRESVEQLLRPVVVWLSTGGDAWEMDLGYWKRRRALMDGGEVFEGPPSDILSRIDTAMDSFSPDSDRGSHQVDEQQLRSELGAAIRELRQLGYLTG